MSIVLFSSTMTTKCHQGSQSTSFSQPPRPLPDSSFIISNIPVDRPVHLTTAIKQGKAAAKKRKVAPAKKNGEAAKEEKPSALN